MQSEGSRVRVVRGYELEPSGTEGFFAGGLATPGRGTGEVSVIRQRQEPGAVGPLHLHDREEVMVQLSGSARVAVGEEVFELSRGDALIVPSDTEHRVEGVGDSGGEWLLVAPSGVRFFSPVDGREISPSWAQ